MIALRAHHLLCMLTFVGRGYSASFVQNLAGIVARIDEGESIEIVDGPDDICAPLLTDPDAHCRLTRVRSRDIAASEALDAELGIDARAGSRFSVPPALLMRLRSRFQASSIRGACAGCEWAALCTDVASENFIQSKLQGSGQSAA
ncbi:DUF1284 domain-containing protein [Lichenihabitans psoromatis]|uniref:DUF1284 domain-containing protein n=1 Tax=Lichenihabitans psoromatis TaxID=2528642 RepID=UPI001035CF8B|nr:DUF1284 domain-containing protein [Lichenihabitans psoromatis]